MINTAVHTIGRRVRADRGASAVPGARPRNSARFLGRRSKTALRGWKPSDPPELDFGTLAPQAVLAARDHGRASADGMRTERDAIVPGGASRPCTRARTLRHVTLQSWRPAAMRACRTAGFHPCKVSLHPRRGGWPSERVFRMAQGLRNWPRMTIPTDPVIGVDVGASTISAGVGCPHGTVLAPPPAAPPGGGPGGGAIFTFVGRAPPPGPGRRPPPSRNGVGPPGPV